MPGSRGGKPAAWVDTPSGDATAELGVSEDAHGNVVYAKTGNDDNEDPPEDVPVWSVDDIRANRKRYGDRVDVRSAKYLRTLIRTVYLIVDTSKALSPSPCTHLPPTKPAALLSCLGQWIGDYFASNPLSTLGIIALSQQSARILLPPSPGGTHGGDLHIRVLSAMLGPSASFLGLASVQVGLEVACASLASVPAYSTREILMVYSSLSTHDSTVRSPTGSLTTTVPAALKEAKVKLHAITLESELHVLRTLTAQTGGTISTTLSKAHLQRLLATFTTPPIKSRSSGGCRMVTHAFPTLETSDVPTLVSSSSGSALALTGYKCPRCLALCSTIPGPCNTCGVRMVSSLDLSRSFRSIQPLAPFDECVGSGTCKGCLKAFTPITTQKGGRTYENRTVKYNPSIKMSNDSGALTDVDDKQLMAFRCTKCSAEYCYECDMYLHEEIGACPGCAK